MILELTSAQRRTLRARAHPLHANMIIGDAGLTTPVLNEINKNLNSHELLKIRVLSDDYATRDKLLAEICASLHAAPVQHIGKILVVYRPLPEDPDAKTQTKKANPRRRKPRAATSAVFNAERELSSVIPGMCSAVWPQFLATPYASRESEAFSADRAPAATPAARPGR